MFYSTNHTLSFNVGPDTYGKLHNLMRLLVSAYFVSNFNTLFENMKIWIILLISIQTMNSNVSVTFRINSIVKS